MYPSLSARDAALLALRPPLPAAGAYADAPPGVPLAGDLEAFQTRTLRPLLKLQNPLLLALTADHLARYAPGFAAFDPADQRVRLTRLLKQDARFKRTLYGYALGLCTEPELAFYFAHRAEVRRRLLALVTERLRSQRADLAEAVWRRSADAA